MIRCSEECIPCCDYCKYTLTLVSRPAFTFPFDLCVEVLRCIELADYTDAEIVRSCLKSKQDATN